MRKSLKPALCRLRRNIPERHILWDRFHRAKIPHPVMEKSMDNILMEDKISFHEKMSLVAAIRRRLFDKNPMSYSFTRDRLRYNGYPCDGKQHSVKSTSLTEMLMDNAVKENKLFFLDKMSLVAAIRRRLFDENPLKYSFTLDRVRNTLKSFGRKQLCIKFSRILFHETLPNVQRRIIPRLFKFKDLMNKFRMKFDQAIHQELARIINLQTLLPRCRSMALM